jgi:hypothetical protein
MTKQQLKDYRAALKEWRRTHLNSEMDAIEAMLDSSENENAEDEIGSLPPSPPPQPPPRP